MGRMKLGNYPKAVKESDLAENADFKFLSISEYLTMILTLKT